MTIVAKIKTIKAEGEVVVSGSGLTDIFAQLPIEAAMVGLGLINDGVPVVYEITVVVP